MRPIERGSLPVDNKNKPKVFSKYQDAKGDLIDRLGAYCFYCERRVDASLAVEHKQPKKKNQDLELSWGNFLLGCANCNSTKKDKDVRLDDYYWPDRDNTYAMCNFLRKNNGLLAMRLRMLFSRLPKIVGLKKVAHRVLSLLLTTRRVELLTSILT